MIEANLEYYCRRREQERSLEAAATSPEAAAAHATLALVYAERVRALMSGGPRLRLVVSNPPLPIRAAR